jgi:HEAT repeat protein
MGWLDRFRKKPEDAPRPDARVGELVRQLGAEDWNARFEAARALGALGAAAAEAQGALEDATSDEHNEVCTAAADALSAIRRALDAR